MSRDLDKYSSLLDPFRSWGPQEIQEAVDKFLSRSHLYSFETDIRRGAVLAQDPDAYRDWNELTRSEERNVFAGDAQRSPELFLDEKRHLLAEFGLGETNSGRLVEQLSNKTKFAGSLNNNDSLTTQLLLGWRQYWSQHPMVHALVGCCSLGAAVQGWDESAVNGAQVEYQNPDALSIDNQGVLGLVNSAPYLMCIFSCLLTEPLNKILGRKGTIIFTCFFSFASCLGQAFVSHWRQLLICRLLLGFGIGPKTATIPIYAAESVPELCRGAMVMQWQLWTAFGIMAGLITSYIFRDTGAKWRIMLGSPLVPAAVLLFLMLSMPESPRWYLLKGHREQDRAKLHLHYERAFRSLWRMRHTKLQAARDLFLLDRLLTIELDLVPKSNTQVKPTANALKTSLEKHRALWTHDRCRRAMIAVLVVMVFQQLCGLNILSYYSSMVFGTQPTGVNEPTKATFGYSMGLGAVNFLLALPALFLIDTVGRRTLLLVTFPIMSIALFVTALAYLVPEVSVQESLIRIFCFLFTAAYSIGEGPVPLVYASESLPLVVRDTGIGIATAIYWGFSFLVAMTFPSLYKPKEKLTSKWHIISFGIYALLCLIGFLFILMFVPETKRLHLEQLDTVFSTPYSEIIPKRLTNLWHPFHTRSAWPKRLTTTQAQNRKAATGSEQSSPNRARPLGQSTDEYKMN